MTEARAHDTAPWTTRRFLAIAAAVWALLSVLSLLRHYTFHSSVYDVGIFDQVLWNTAHGRPFASSLSHMSYLGDHFSPSLALLAPIEWLPRSLDLLFLAQGLDELRDVLGAPHTRHPWKRGDNARPVDPLIFRYTFVVQAPAELHHVAGIAVHNTQTNHPGLSLS